MFLSDQDIFLISSGAVCVEENNGGISLLRFKRDCIEIFGEYSNNAASGASIFLNFETDATEVIMDFLVCTDSLRDIIAPAIDVYIDDSFIHHFEYDLDSGQFGKLDFKLERGIHKICIYLPFHIQISIQTFELVNATFFTSVSKPDKKYLLIGDSITQGYFCKYPSLTYATTLGSLMNVEILNHGIGGYRFDKRLIQKIDYRPDTVLVALGINDVFSDDILSETIPDFFARLLDEYSDTNIVAVTPIICLKEYAVNRMAEVKRQIYMQKGLSKNLYIIEGEKLVPHLLNFFADSLHPSTIGMQYYAQSLMTQIKDLQL